MLLKKIDRSQIFLAENLGLFLCPVCHEPLTKLNGYQLACQEGHQFDLNKKGSLNFLNHKIATDYDREMLLHRQKMIQGGLYQPLIEKILIYLGEEPVETLLDVGCGEGSLLNQVSAAGVPGKKIGFDISKDGVALATEQVEPAFWCVADLTNLPFTDDSITHLLNIFSPSHYEEFRRVLSPKGRLIKVVPGEHYLKELRQVFYADQREKQHYSNEKVVAKFQEEMTLVAHEELHYEFPVPPELQASLLNMSPIQWGATEENRAMAREKQIKSITIHVEILVGEH